MDRKSLETRHEVLGMTLGEALITPTKIYVKALRAVREAKVSVHGCSHITGGGFYENIPRMLPEGARAVVRKDSYRVPEIFRMLAKAGDIDEHMMYNTYNMGIGMVLAVPAAEADAAAAALKAAGETCCMLGEVTAGEKGVALC